MESQIKVILKPHVGWQDTDAGRVAYTHPSQWMVYFTAPPDMPGEKFIGYLPKEAGRPFLPTQTFLDQPEGLKPLIQEAVSVAAGDPRPLGIVPVSLEALEKYERMKAGEDDDEDDDEDESEEE